MNVKKHPIDNYKRFLLNRATTTTAFVEFIENMLAAEDDTANYCFHKIMVHNWNYQNEVLFDTLTEYFTAWFIPVDVTRQGDITTFYTSNLNLILRFTRLDFLFPFDKNMFNIDVLFNDKASIDFFDNNININDVISSVVAGRFNEKKELDLSNFCNDQEFKDKKISFYKISLLANFKLLMLRIGRDTKSLNLAQNQLTQPPLDVMNFFIKGDLTEVNLSYNKIHSISDLIRVSSKIEKLWVEGNPLCDDHDPSMYVKLITGKFPRLTELDGIKLNEFGVNFPFFRNYMCSPTKHLKMVVEKFLTLYFSQYDTAPRRKNIAGFYDNYCCLSVSTGFTDEEKLSMPSLHATIGDNILTPSYKRSTMEPSLSKNKVYTKKLATLNVLSQLPNTQHDPTTFTVDVLSHDVTNRTMMIIVDGIFRDVETKAGPSMFRFRRTFLFRMYGLNATTTGYKIHNEMIHIALPTKDQIAQSFRFPIRNMNTFELVNPEYDEIEVLVKIFCHLSQLKKEEAEIRLRLNNWDLKTTITQFTSDVAADKVKQDLFMEEYDFSDSSSLIDDEMVD